jgi:hypothetical protein
MAADTPGSRLKVLAAGLHQLGARCEKLSGELCAEAAPSFVAASPWQANAGALNIACSELRKDLAVLAGRLSTRGTKYSRAGASYTATDDDGAAKFRGLPA